MTLKKQILYCLKQYPDTRNSDITLMFRVWQNFTNKLIYSDKNEEYYLKIKDLYEMPREDHIKRVRAKIQNEDKMFMPTDPAVLKARRQEEHRWLDQLGYNKANKLAK